MPENQLITLTARSMADAIEVKIVTSNGFDGDADLVLHARRGIAGDGDTWSLAIGPEDAEAIWELLDEFELRGARSRMMGMDGTTFTLTIDSYPLAVSVEWWERAPLGWKGPARLADELLRLAGPEAGSFRRR